VSYGTVKVEISSSAHKLKGMLCELRDFSDMKRLLKLLPLYLLALLLVLSVAQLSAQESELQAGDRVIVLAYRLPVYVQADTDAVVATEMTAGMVSRIVAIEEQIDGRSWVYLEIGAHGWVENTRDGDATLTEYSEERHAQMIDEASVGIDQNPDDTAFYLMRASIYAYQQNIEAAQADFNRVIELEPDEAWFYELRARFLTNAGQAEAAIGDLEHAIELGAAFPTTWNRLALAYDNAYGPEVALPYFQEAAQRAPQYGLIYSNLGLEYFKIGSYSEAISQFSRAIEIDPYLAVAVTHRGHVYYELGDYGAAFEDYNIALSIDPFCADCRRFRGLYFSDIDANYLDAISDFTIGLEANPNDFALYTNRGISYFRSGQSGAAIDDLEKAIELDPTHEHAYFTLGSSYADLGEYELALQSYTEVINRFPDTDLGFGAQLYRSQVYLALGDYDNALLDIEAYIGDLSLSNPQNQTFFVVALLVHGQIDLAQHNYVSAINSYLVASSVDNSFIKNYYAFGGGYRVTRQQEVRMTELQTALVSDPTAQGYWQLANLQMEIGLWEQARQSFEYYLDVTETPDSGLKYFLVAMEGVLW
jgi:tetratricopeptide (TPR) repeat protein